MPPPPPVANDIAGQKPKHILIVDDDPQILKLIEDILEDYRVTSILDPHEAIRILADSRHDIKLVISDYKMPEMTGLDLYRQLKTLSGAARQSIHFFIVTGTHSKSIEEEALRLGVDAFLYKPFMPDFLLAKVKNIMGA